MEKLPIYIDFDKTITPVYGFTEPPSDMVIESINTLASKYKIIIYSVRANLTSTPEASYLELLEYLGKYNIPYDEIYADKPLFVAIIDDKSFNPLKESWDDITNQIMSST